MADMRIREGTHAGWTGELIADLRIRRWPTYGYGSARDARRCSSRSARPLSRRQLRQPARPRLRDAGGKA